MHQFLLSCMCLFLFATLIAFPGGAQPVQMTFGDTMAYHPKWSPDGLSIAITKRAVDYVDIHILPASGGIPAPLNIPKEGDFAFDWSPDGTQIVFDAYSPQGPPSDLYKLTLASGGITTLVNNTLSENHPTWSPDHNTIVYASGPNLYKIPADGGTPALLTFDNYEDFHPAFSPDGTEVLFTSMRSGNADLWRIPLSGGTAVQVTFDPSDDDRGCWSPDGGSIAFVSDRNGNNDIYTMNLATGEIKQITFHPAFDSHPDWSPDGQKIVFASQRSGDFNVWMVDLTTTGISVPQNDSDHGFHAFPNPSADNVWFTYRTKPGNMVKLSIANSAGNRIITLVDSNTDPGSHCISWNGTNRLNEKVPAGIYYALFQIDAQILTQKIIVL